MVIGAGNKVEVRTLQTGRSIGDNWLVSSGLQAGDKIIVEGGMMLRPGMAVQGKPWNSNAKPAAAQPQVGKAQAK